MNEKNMIEKKYFTKNYQSDFPVKFNHQQNL